MPKPLKRDPLKAAARVLTSRPTEKEIFGRP